MTARTSATILGDYVSQRAPPCRVLRRLHRCRHGNRSLRDELLPRRHELQHRRSCHGDFCGPLTLTHCCEFLGPATPLFPATACCRAPRATSALTPKSLRAYRRRSTLERSAPSEWVSIFGHSTPTTFGNWYQVSSVGTVTATVPFGLAPGEHSLVAQSATNKVLGWNPVTVHQGTLPPVSGAPVTGGTPTRPLTTLGTTAPTHAWTLEEIVKLCGADTAALWPSTSTTRAKPFRQRSNHSSLAAPKVSSI